MIILDTTVLVYATGGDHPLRAPARAIMRALTDDALRATTTVEVVQEFAHVRARRSGRAEAAHLAEQFQMLLSPLVEVSAADLVSGLRIWQTVPRLGAFDAVLAAAARHHSMPLVSADQAFATVEELAHIPLDGITMTRLHTD